MDCPRCGEPLSDGRPRYYITLSAGEETSEADRSEERLCERCWERYREELC